MGSAECIHTQKVTLVGVMHLKLITMYNANRVVDGSSESYAGYTVAYNPSNRNIKILSEKIKNFKNRFWTENKKKKKSRL